VIEIHVPPLRARKSDIPLLVAHALASTPARAVSEDAMALLLAYDWPGNVRELRNVVERFSTFEAADPKLLFDAPQSSRGGASLEALAALPYHEAKKRLMDDFHRTVLPLVVERAGGSVPRAAELLGIPKASLYRMLQDLRDGETPP